MDYIILNNDGSLQKQSLTRYINQGSHGVDKIFIGWANGLATDILQVVFTLPNQTTNTELGTFEEDYAYDGEHTINGWVFTLTNAQTLYNGALMVSVRIIRSGIVQVAYPFALIINETGVRPDDDSGITLDQLDSYLQYVQTFATTNYVDTELAKKLDKINVAGQVYVTDGSGNQAYIPYGAGAIVGRIVQRVENGNINVPETPTNNTHAASKKYVDDTCVKVTGNQNVAGVKTFLDNVNLDYQKSVQLFEGYIRNSTTTLFGIGTDESNRTYYALPQGSVVNNPNGANNPLVLATTKDIENIYNQPATVRKYFITNEGKDFDSSGNVVNSTSDRGVSDLIPLENVTQITISTKYGGYNTVLYNKEKQMITRLQLSSNYQNILKMSDYPTAKFVRFAGYWGSGSNDESFYLITTYKFNVSLLSKFDSKNVLIFGDSITENADMTVNSSNETTAYNIRKVGSSSYQYRNMWASILSNMYNFKEIRNYALSGATWVGDIGNGTRGNAATQVQTALNDKLNPHNVFQQDDFEPDIVIFCFGANDSAPADDYNTAMGKTVLVAGSSYNIDVDATLNNLDKTKLFQAIRWSLLTIKNNFPKAQVYVSLPIQGAKFYPNEMFDNSIIESIEKMARRCGCVIINANNESGIIPEGNFYNPTNQGETLQDGLHPNKLGQQLLARAIISSLESHYIDLDLLK